MIIRIQLTDGLKGQIVLRSGQHPGEEEGSNISTKIHYLSGVIVEL